MSTIPFTPDMARELNELCEQSNLSASISRLMDAEEAMQKLAHAEPSGELDYLFRFAYGLKLIRERFERIEKKLGYESDRE